MRKIIIMMLIVILMSSYVLATTLVTDSGLGSTYKTVRGDDSVFTSFCRAADGVSNDYNCYIVYDPGASKNCIIYSSTMTMDYHLSVRSNSGSAKIGKVHSYNDYSTLTWSNQPTCTELYSQSWTDSDLFVSKSVASTLGSNNRQGEITFCAVETSSTTVDLSWVASAMTYTYSAIPVLSGIPDQSLDENSVSTINIDLFSYFSDDESDSSATYAIQSESNTAVIDCFIQSNRYLKCNNPTGNRSGTSSIVVRARDQYYSSHGGCNDNQNTDTLIVTVVPIVVLDSPGNYSFVNDDPFNLTWRYNKSDTENVNYTIYLSTNDTFPPVFFDYSTVNNTFNYTVAQYTLTYLQGYYWRIEGCYDGNCLNSSVNHFTFNVSSLEPLDMIPANESSTEIPVTLTWTTGRRVGASKDWLEVGNTSSSWNVLNDTSFSIPDDNSKVLSSSLLNSETQYWWRVRTEYTDGTNSSWVLQTFNTTTTNITTTLVPDDLQIYPHFDPTEKNVTPQEQTTTQQTFNIKNLRGIAINISLAINETPPLLTRILFDFDAVRDSFGNVTYTFDTVTKNEGNASFFLKGDI